MKSLRVRFAIGFSLLFTVFLAIALLIVYISYSDFRKEEFYKRLKDRAITNFKLLVEVEQIDHDLLQVIDRNTLNSLYDVQVLIFQGDSLIYSSIDEKRTLYDINFIKEVHKKKEIFTTRGDEEVVAITLTENGKPYILQASALDKLGRRKMLFLKWVMIIVYFSGLVIGWTATYFFVKKVIRPLEVLKKNIQNIDSANLDIRLNQRGQGEEVDSLATNFNQMLERLQQAFSVQKNFVHYASHELRTPLTAMIGITENALCKNLDVSEHEKVLEQLFQQQLNLTEITNSLLLLSDKKNITANEYPSVRLDELLFRSADIIQNLFSDANIAVNLAGVPPSEEALMVRANEPLLLMAFNNLLKNALQYSKNNQAIVTIRISNNIKEVEFKNLSDPFEKEETQLIFTPFYRASNATSVKGYGLGLSLVKQIAELHNATINYSREGDFNVFYFRFP